MAETRRQKICDVAVIGAGPAGLAAAAALKKAGIGQVTVLEREPEAGGIPRHCGHPPFGLREYRRMMRGPAYAKRLVETAVKSGVDLQLNATVTTLGKGGLLSVLTPQGPWELKAGRVLLATGTRETPRSARLVSGDRALGICNTGTLQAMFYLKNLVPFRCPVIVGTEIVSFSALLTCRKAGIEPVAVLEENPRPTVAWPFYHAARFFGVPLRLQTRIIRIQGNGRVNGVLVSDQNGDECRIDCDGVLFTGQFTPESSLARMSHLELDPDTGSPAVDQFGRCSDPSYYAAGNIMHHPVEVAGKCWSKGRLVAGWIAKDLAGELPGCR